MRTGSPARENSTAFSTSLSRSCAARSAAPATGIAWPGRSQREGRPRIGDAVALHAAAHQRLQVEALALRGAQALLQAARLAHPLQDRVQPREPVLGALDVGARFLGVRRQLQVLQRGAHHRDRRAQLVRQAPRHAFQVGMVLRELRQHGREAARQVADLVARVRAGGESRDAAARVDRAFRLVAQPPDALRQARTRRRSAAPRRRGTRSASATSSRSSASLRSVAIGLVVSSTTTAPATSLPFHTGCAADTTTARPSTVRRVRLPGVPCSAAAMSRPRGQHVVGHRLGEILARALDQPARQGAATRARSSPACSDRRLGAPQAARQRQHLVAAVHHPDARLGALHAAQDRRDVLLRGARGERGFARQRHRRRRGIEQAPFAFRRCAAAPAPPRGAGRRRARAAPPAAAGGRAAPWRSRARCRSSARCWPSSSTCSSSFT